mmetsp:Transcript_6486/g.14174  ORF Transcript_6486/g.14174 Transcript_6486/m.14174 type:complete len:731 (-) Transcript_6486:44-2236(-)
MSASMTHHHHGSSKEKKITNNVRRRLLYALFFIIMYVRFRTSIRSTRMPSMSSSSDNTAIRHPKNAKSPTVDMILRYLVDNASRDNNNDEDGDDDLMTTVLLKQNYFYQAWLGSASTSNVTSAAVNDNDDGTIDDDCPSNHHREHLLLLRRILPPFDVLTTFIQQHSETQLEHEYQQYNQQKWKNKQPNNILQRKYLVASWACPLESGNRLHRFMNGLLWSVLTNRTMLWRYHTPEVCEEYDEQGFESHPTHSDCPKLYGSNIDPHVDCSDILRLASWVPSYDKWMSRITEMHNNPNTLSSLTTTTSTTATTMKMKNLTIVRYAMQQGGMGNWVQLDAERVMPWDRGPRRTRHDRDDHDGDGDDSDDVPLLVRPGRQLSLNPGSVLIKYRDGPPYLNRSQNQYRLHNLTTNLLRMEPSKSAVDHNGKTVLTGPFEQEQQRSQVYFIYGMLFESLFTIHPSVLLDDDVFSFGGGRTTTTHPATSSKSTTLWDFALSNSSSTTPSTSSTPSTTDASTTKTYIIHSRHPNKGMVRYTWPEHVCMQKMFDTTKDEPCRIWVMSDSNITLPLLHDEISNLTRCEHSSQYNPSSSSGRTHHHNRSTGTSFSDEHGPFAGRGYWEDLSVAIQARDGMIAFHKARRSHGLVRTSTALVRNLIQFRRVLEHVVSNVDWSTGINTNSHITRSTSPGATSTAAGGGCEDDNSRNNNNIKRIIESIPPIPAFEECRNPFRGT